MAGALLRDSFVPVLLAQLKFRNISSRELLALKVSVTMLDIAGRRIGEPVEYQYLDIHARRMMNLAGTPPLSCPMPQRALSASL